MSVLFERFAKCLREGITLRIFPACLQSLPVHAGYTEAGQSAVRLNCDCAPTRIPVHPVILSSRRIVHATACDSSRFGRWKRNVCFWLGLFIYALKVNWINGTGGRRWIRGENIGIGKIVSILGAMNANFMFCLEYFKNLLLSTLLHFRRCWIGTRRIQK